VGDTTYAATPPFNHFSARYLSRSLRTVGIVGTGFYTRCYAGSYRPPIGLELDFAEEDSAAGSKPLSSAPGETEDGTLTKRIHLSPGSRADTGCVGTAPRTATFLEHVLGVGLLSQRPAAPPAREAHATWTVHPEWGEPSSTTGRVNPCTGDLVPHPGKQW
jgi:hypothetical protein